MSVTADSSSWVDLEIQEDLAKLQGAWQTIAGRRAAELLIRGDAFTMRFGDGDVYSGVFELDPTASPRSMLMWIKEGPARHKGKLTLCIYELTADELHWCAAEPGADERLTGFPALEDRRHLRLILRRR